MTRGTVQFKPRAAALSRGVTRKRPTSMMAIASQTVPANSSPNRAIAQKDPGAGHHIGGLGGKDCPRAGGQPHISCVKHGMQDRHHEQGNTRFAKTGGRDHRCPLYQHRRQQKRQARSPTPRTGPQQDQAPPCPDGPPHSLRSHRKAGRSSQSAARQSCRGQAGWPSAMRSAQPRPARTKAPSAAPL